MKIEKISDTQVKFTLSNNDLEERDMKIAELTSYSSEKTQRLFKEMLEQALILCDFEADDIPLMIEAMPISFDSVVILVTKVMSEDDVEQRLDTIPRTRDSRRFKPKRVIRNKCVANEKYVLFSFDELNDVSDVSSILNGRFKGNNALYRLQEKYYLFMNIDNDLNKIAYNDLEAILSEYGQKHMSTSLSQYYLEEHGEVIIKENPIEILAKYFN